ncbi:unnamed protein product [Trifolium pratense]|uniref:Uncharacterized protein n=1 Tax=Trifolium pratense TaxID=57577 RepID=A0ACB0I959_TRIPR|nr:unnamed protein product [Trifolium pratense]
MADKGVTIRTRKFMTNRLLSRKQFSILNVFFPLEDISKDLVVESDRVLTDIIKSSDSVIIGRPPCALYQSRVIIFPYVLDGIQNNNLFFQFFLLQNGLDTKVEKSRKQMKERKNRSKKIRGVKKTKAGDAAKGGKKK